MFSAGLVRGDVTLDHLAKEVVGSLPLCTVTAPFLGSKSLHPGHPDGGEDYAVSTSC